MPNNKQILNEEEIQLLEKIGVNPNSENLKEEVQKVLKVGIETSQEFDSGGISKTVNWQGGGDFIYFELAKYNETFMDLVQSATTTEQLLKIWLEMKEKAFLDYRVETTNFDSEEFKTLSLEDQKTLLVQVLDKNQLYVNYTEMEDETYNISKEDKDLTNKFYGK
jgi:adenine-specific DNA-methyltransferase